MDDRIRVSDADRERVAARLREHFAEGRLTQEELDERITATLSAKTFGDLRRVMADLPEPAPAPPSGWSSGWQPGWQPGRWGPRPGPVACRRPRILAVALVLLIAALVLPGASWLFFGFIKLVLVFWLVTSLIALLAAARFGRRVRRAYRDGATYGGQWRHYHWRGW